jgi:hypothetical protein
VLDESLKSAVEAFVARITAKEAEIHQLKLSTNVMARDAGMEPIYPDVAPEAPLGTMRPDEYYGKPFMGAARDYLKRRGHAVGGEEIVAGLEAGNFDFDAIGWKKEHRLRTVASYLAKNPAIFHKMPNGLIGLLEWYPEASERRKAAKKDDDAAEDTKNGNGKEEKVEGKKVEVKKNEPVSK